MVGSDDVSWFYPNGTTISDAEALFQNSRRTIELSDVQISDAGEYKCEARIPSMGSDFSSGTATVQLEVYGRFRYYANSTCV